MLLRHLTSLSFLALAPAVAFAADHDTRLDALGDTLEPGVQARLGSTRLLHNNKITGLALTSGGDIVASGSMDGEVRVWSSADGVELFATSIGEGGVRSLSISADGSRLAVGSTREFALVWDVITREQLLRVDGGDIVALAPDGKTLAVAGADDELQLVELDVDESRTIEGRGFKPTTLRFSPDGEWVAKTVWNKERAEGEDGEALVAAVLEVYSRESGELVWSRSYEEPRLQQPSFAKDGAELLVVDHSGDLTTFATESGEVLRTSSAIEECIFAVSGQDVVAALESGGAVHVWTAGAIDERKPLLTGTESATAAAMSSDGSTLALALGREVTIWSTGSRERTIAFDRHVTPVAALAFSPDGTRLVSGSFSGEVRLWDAATGSHLKQLGERGARVFVARFSPDAERVGAVDWNGDVRLWDPETGELVASFGESAASVTGFDFSPDGKHVACASTAGVLRVIDVETGEQRFRGEDLPGNLIHVAWSPDGSKIAVGARDLLLIDAESGEELRRWERLGSPLNTIAWSPDGVHLAAGLAAKLVRVYDTTSDAAPRDLTGHRGRVNALAFSPSGSLLFSGGYGENVVRVWDPATGTPLGELTGYPEQVLALDVSPDGRRVAVAGLDANTVVLDLEAAGIGG